MLHARLHRKLQRLSQRLGIPEQVLLDAALFEFLEVGQNLRLDILSRYLKRKPNVKQSRRLRFCSSPGENAPV